MAILRVSNKGRILNTLERFHIYKETKNQKQINDRHTIFDALLPPPPPFKHEPTSSTTAIHLVSTPFHFANGCPRYKNSPHVTQQEET
jgi:hypothetical protein